MLWDSGPFTSSKEDLISYFRLNFIFFPPTVLDSQLAQNLEIE